MQASNRWRNWKPTGSKFADSLSAEVPKVSNASFATFGTPLPEQTQNFSTCADTQSEPSPRPETMAQVELMPAEIRQWDDAMLVWAKAHCIFRDHNWGSLPRLYISHIDHADKSGSMFAPDCETFQAILMALGFHIQDGFVYGLILREERTLFR
jgi:hypothetical protein